MSAPFDAERFREHAATLALGHPIVATLHTGSTNDDALAAARDGAPHGALFVTEEQSAGRGRRGNTWLAPRGEGLLFSLVLRPELGPERAPALALLAGLAVRAAVAELLDARATHARTLTENDAAEAAEPRVLVKWPNDVVIVTDKLRKLAGVLVESVVRGGRLGAVVIGVGLNVGRLGLPSELADMATSLALLGVTVTRERLLANVLAAMEVRLTELETAKHREKPLQSCAAELARFDALYGSSLRVDDLFGHGAGIDDEGSLKVVDPSGRTHRVVSGHVTLAQVDGRAEKVGERAG
ncbi:MAG TPA: biotin--[acetyl-CoA-carboxylase] ligase [Polyangiaceae bacterium]|nr:biotin--[acetyl-CoA-carboxylase] ligase [Polyangiaceae bacterium]